MVLTITVVGNGQNTGNGGHAVLSPNELAQLMSGQTVTGLLNPDGSITLNSNVMSTQQLTSLQSPIQNGSNQITSSINDNYSSRQQTDHVMTTSSNSISNLQALNSDAITAPANNHSQTTTSTSTTGQKKTGQKRLTAKQKLAIQQQQQQQQSQLLQPLPGAMNNQQQSPIPTQHQMQQLQQMQSSDNRLMMATQTDQSMNQQPQIVATVQLPNGQIGQLIAPSGGQFWSPDAINLQQLSMAVAAATGGTIPQAMPVPGGQPTSNSSGSNVNQPSQIDQASNQMQNSGQQQQQQQQQQSQPQSHQTSQSISNQNQQQVLSTVQLPNNQIVQVIGRPGQSSIWSGGPITLSQLSALAQQGVVQLAPVQGIPGPGPNGQRVVEMLPQSAIQDILSQCGQPIQSISMANGNQFMTQNPNDSGKWQLIPGQVSSSLQTSGSLNGSTANTAGPSESSNIAPRANGTLSTSQSFSSNSGSSNTSQNNSTLGGISHSTQPQRKLKRLACTCPNCRDGDSGRNSGDKKRQHVCHIAGCNKIYGKTSHLRAHLRWHSGERPYVCNWSFCGKKFTRSDELQRHRRTHTGEKRFQCPECLKRFMRSDHLSKHLKTHLSSKKSLTGPQPNKGEIVGISQDQIKIEQEMIDDIALQSMEEPNDKQ